MKSLFPRKAVLPALICLLPILAGVLLYPRLPERVVTHWNFAGQPDGYSSRLFAVVGLPLILLGCHLLLAVVLTHDPRRKNMSSALFAVSLWSMPVLSVVIQGLVLVTALGGSLPVNAIVPGLVGLMFMVVGNYLPKCKPNYSMGIRLPWTLNSEENWNRTHRLAGWLWMAGGLLLAVSGLAGWSKTTLPVLILLVVVPAVYSFHLYRKGI